MFWIIQFVESPSLITMEKYKRLGNEAVVPKEYDLKEKTSIFFQFVLNGISCEPHRVPLVLALEAC